MCTPAAISSHINTENQCFLHIHSQTLIALHMSLNVICMYVLCPTPGHVTNKCVRFPFTAISQTL